MSAQTTSPLPVNPALRRSSNHPTAVGDAPSDESGARLPRVAAMLLTVAFLTWAAGAAYTLSVNPEIAFFKQIAGVKQRWAQKMTDEHGNKTVFFGGSSCTFSIMPERLLKQHAIPAANLGLGAGMGLRVLTRSALEQARPGDTLIMAMEPEVLLNPLEDTMLGIQISYALHRPQWLAEGTSVAATGPVSWIRTALMLRPGGYHVFTLLGKLLTGKPLYRYQVNEVDVTGWEHSPLHREPHPSVGSPGPLPEDVRQFLISLKEWCAQHQMRVAYSLPWTYTDETHLKELQENNRRLLEQISSIIPVLQDQRLGVDTVREHFADTVWHLNRDAAETRTDIVAKAVRSWQVWSPTDLANIATLSSNAPTRQDPSP